MGLFDFFNKDKGEKLNQGLFLTRQSFFSRLSKIITGKTIIDASVLADLEEVLLAADVGVDTSMKIIGMVEKRAEKLKNPVIENLREILKEEIAALLQDAPANGFSLPEGQKPYVIMVVGVNGVGKTTTIGKLAWRLKKSGLNVVVGAADTFRAAAVDQLKIWGERTGVPVVSHGMNADPAAVAFDTLKSAAAKGADVVIIDTAGRLHNKVNLMNELIKIKKVMQKVVPAAPHEVLLVLDASTGQNAIEQCRQFTAATAVNALALTKLDGTARGGVVIGICGQFKIPVRYVGVGEGIEDLRIFDKNEFIDSLFEPGGASS